MTEKRLTIKDAEESRLKNIIDMAFAFTSMTRVFEAESSEKIIELLRDKFKRLDDIRDIGAYRDLHEEFCTDFVNLIKTSPRKNHPSGTVSYGQAAKVFDIAVKVYVYYCEYSDEQRSRLMLMMYGAIDTPILKHLKSEYKDRGILAATISDIDKELYLSLQDLIKREIELNGDGCTMPVQYDDIMWRRLKEEDARKKREKGR